MKLIKCSQCGSSKLVEEGGYMICQYCGTRFAMSRKELGVKGAGISMNADIEALLKKCRTDRKNAKKYANLILDLDPDNEEALKYL